MKRPLIFDIQRFCLHDGPGIRSLVFFKGCTLNCCWCCNPESQSCAAELMQNQGRCIGCGACLAGCPNGALRRPEEEQVPEAWQRSTEAGAMGPVIDRQQCTVCGRCAAACPSGALEVTGRQVSVAEVLAELLRDRCFFDISGGGVTLSGGEPLLHCDFAEALLAELKGRGIHTTVETAGHVPWHAFERVAPQVELFYYDLKHVDDRRHREWTGASNRCILDNLRRLVERHPNVVVRIPLVPGFNCDEPSIEAIARTVAPLSLAEVTLLPLHRLGESKYRALGRTYSVREIEPPGAEEVARLATRLQVLSGQTVRIGG